MNWRLAIGISVLLNLGLGIALLLPTRQPPAAVQTQSPSGPVTKTNAEPLSPRAGQTPAGLSLQWSQIANADLKIYHGNLNAIGCPDATVCEIIRAEINHRFAPRRAAIVAAFQPRAWDFLVRGELALNWMIPQTEWGQSLMALGEERRQLIAGVLGGDRSDSEAEQRFRHENLMRQFSWLPAGKRDRLIALEDQYQHEMMNWAGSLVNGTPAPEDKDRPQKLLQELEQSKQELLTPDELAELQLRESNEAGWAGNLSGFETTEDEWRAVTQLRLNHDEDQRQLANPDLGNEQRTALQNELQANFDQAVKSALGSDRYCAVSIGQQRGIPGGSRRDATVWFAGRYCRASLSGAKRRHGCRRASAKPSGFVPGCPPGGADGDPTGNRTEPGANPRARRSAHLQRVPRRLDHGPESGKLGNVLKTAAVAIQFGPNHMFFNTRLIR